MLIDNMALGNHPNGVFLQPKNNKPFRVEDYPMFITFLDLKKLASHRYIFAPIYYSQHWWLWLADTRKRKFYIVDPYHTKSPSDERTALNTFILGVFLFNIRCNFVLLWVYFFIEIIHGYVILRIKVYAGGTPLKTRDKDKEIEHHTLTSQAKKQAMTDEVDHFRVEYASRILFHEMNQDKAEAIRGSNAIRLSKPSSLLLSPYCQIDSKDIDTD
ncbi:hypothetical protein Ahy_B08g091487 [Arachis hypogaea]|uniref:Ubiquitin-like protease family profile domain-containing protein n=1 Tax=Arachis hypogaea TaxID=3818 RepID=A0A444Y263_ARAHY|nr:hypothetical protein Ahy_B08g091487 [Arachis hypogaea]